MSHRLLDGDKLAELMGMRDAIERMEEALRAKADGRLISPTRFFVRIDTGSLAITGGGQRGDDGVLGFNAAVWANNTTKPLPDAKGLVVIFDSRSGTLKAVLIGKRVLAYRTPAVTAVAIRHLARPDAKNLGIMGSGRQAWLVLEAAAEVQSFERIMVYSPTPSHRQELAQEMSVRLRRPVEAASDAEEVVRRAEVLACCTTSPSPVFDAAWLQPGVLVTSTGPKYRGAHEVPMEASERSALIVTDSLGQVDGHSSHLGPYYLADTPHRERMVELSDIVVGKQLGRRSADDIILFSPLGLAGAEILLADEAIKRAGTRL